MRDTQYGLRGEEKKIKNVIFSKYVLKTDMPNTAQLSWVVNGSMIRSLRVLLAELLRLCRLFLRLQCFPTASLNLGRR